MSYPTPLLLANGVIHTMWDDVPLADAIAIDRANGRIVAVGSEAEVRAALGVFARVEVVDLHGQTVLPGLIDAHTHILAAARDTIEVNLAGTVDAAEAVTRIAVHAATLPKGTWIIGRHWNQNEWPGRQFPTRTALDAAVPDHPCALWTHSQHAVWVNSVALARAGITRDTADPAGGTIARDVDGEPTGMLFESACTRIDEISTAETDDDAQTLAALRRVLAGFAARGLTACYTMEGARSLRLAQTLRGAGTLPLRLGYYLPVTQLEAATTIGLEMGFGDDWLRITGIKIFADGALGTRTAAMLQPFADDPGNMGLLTTPFEQMQSQVTAAFRGGLGVSIHAIGDRAVRTALDGIERALLLAPAGQPRRFRLEHVQLADPADIARMAQLDVVGSVQPFHAVSDRDVAERSWQERAGRGYAYATLANAGVRLALGSDVPIETADPWRIIHAAVARTDDHTPDRPAWHPHQALTVTQALWAYTVGAAWAGGDETRFGQLAPGLLGDCIVLADDPLRIGMRELARMPITATIVGGVVIAGSL